MALRSMARVHSELAAIRHRRSMEQMIANASHAVHFVKKDGTPYKDATSYCKDEASANDRAKELMSLNPGKKVVVIPLKA